MNSQLFCSFVLLGKLAQQLKQLAVVLCTGRCFNEHDSFGHLNFIGKCFINWQLLSNSVDLLSKLRFIIVDALELAKHLLLFHSVLFSEVVIVIGKVTARITLQIYCQSLSNSISNWFSIWLCNLRPWLIHKITEFSSVGVYTLFRYELIPLKWKLFLSWPHDLVLLNRLFAVIKGSWLLGTSTTDEELRGFISLIRWLSLKDHPWARTNLQWHLINLIWFIGFPFIFKAL